MFKRNPSSSQRLFKLEIENGKLKHVIETLRRQSERLRRQHVELKYQYDVLKKSQDKSVSSTRPAPQPALRGLKPTNSQSQASSETADIELRKLIRQLLDTQDRLTVAEQATAATQRRQLIQEHVYENLPTTGVYEELRFDPTQEHIYAELYLKTHTGCLSSVAVSRNLSRREMIVIAHKYLGDCENYLRQSQSYHPLNPVYPKTITIVTKWSYG